MELDTVERLSVEEPGRSSLDAQRRRLGMSCMAVLLFAFCLTLATRENEFPFTYHPDEPSKAAQLLQGRRNFYHPLLLLSTTEYVTRIAVVPRTPQELVETGRWVSAAFAAGAVVALALLAWMRYGALAACAAGVVLSLEPSLFEAAHYMKEDTALVFGLALGLLALQLWWRSPQRANLRFLAVACAIAGSGKYIGIIFLLCALPLIVAGRTELTPFPLRARLKTFALWFCAALLLCNLPLFATKISAPWRGIAREMDAAIGGHGGITRSVPHADYLQMLGETVPPSILILAAAYVGVLLWFRRSRTPAELMTVLLALLYLAILSSSPKIAPRYLIPVTTLLGLLAVCGAAELSRLICGERRARKVAAVVLFAVFTGWLGRDMLQAYQPARLGFERDDPTAAAEWITNNLPPDAVIAEDGSVSLSPSRPGVKIGVASRVPQKVLEAYFAADLGSLDELRSQGVTHVAVSEKMYGRYFAGEGSARKGMSDVYETRRRFYERVLAEGELLAEWPRGINSYLQPGIRIYRVAPPANGATSGSST